ncbi:MAG: hypothetical protein C0433_04205 [Cyclobacterium sp.]|nr:hypothetical protein [Cyclobacterium sp.]
MNLNPCSTTGIFQENRGKIFAFLQKDLRESVSFSVIICGKNLPAKVPSIANDFYHREKEVWIFFEFSLLSTPIP